MHRCCTCGGISAIALYRALGCREIAPDRDNPIAGALYMELTWWPEAPPAAGEAGIDRLIP